MMKGFVVLVVCVALITNSHCYSFKEDVERAKLERRLLNSLLGGGGLIGGRTGTLQNIVSQALSSGTLNNILGIVPDPSGILDTQICVDLLGGICINLNILGGEVQITGGLINAVIDLNLNLLTVRQVGANVCVVIQLLPETTSLFANINTLLGAVVSIDQVLELALVKTTSLSISGLPSLSAGVCVGGNIVYAKQVQNAVTNILPAASVCAWFPFPQVFIKCPGCTVNQLPCFLDPFSVLAGNILISLRPICVSASIG